MSPDRKSRDQYNPNLFQQLMILWLLLGVAGSNRPIVERILNRTAAVESNEAQLTLHTIENFPPGYLESEIIQLNPDDIGKYVAVNPSSTIPNDQIKMHDRLLVEIRKIYKRQTIKGSFQFFEGAEVLRNLDGSFYLGESHIYIASQILYLLDVEDSEKINK